MKKIQSLKSFSLDKRKLNLVRGGDKPNNTQPDLSVYNHGNTSYSFIDGTFDIATYIDGFYSGVDGYWENNIVYLDESFNY